MNKWIKNFILHIYIYQCRHIFQIWACLVSQIGWAQEPFHTWDGTIYSYRYLKRTGKLWVVNNEGESHQFQRSFQILNVSRHKWDRKWLWFVKDIHSGTSYWFSERVECFPDTIRIWQQTPILQLSSNLANGGLGGSRKFPELPVRKRPGKNSLRPWKLL